jgi:hypothetical protein
MNNGFYIYLPSNSSMDVYPGNVCSQYRIRLDNPINLIDKPVWEVGLVELSYVHSLRTIQNGESIYVVENSETVLSTFTLTKTLLNNITKEKNTAVLNETNLEIEVKDGKVHIHMHRPSTTLYLPNFIARHFGFLPPPESNTILEHPIQPVPPSFNLNAPIPPELNNAKLWADYAKKLEQYDAKREVHMQKQKICAQEIAKYTKEKMAYDEHVSSKTKQEQDDCKDENMHFLTNKTNGKWTAVAPYFMSKQPVQSYKPAFNIQLRTWPGVLRILTLREGHYPTAESLLEELKRISVPITNEVKWEYLTSKNRFQVEMKNYTLRLNRTLADVLGFKTSTLKAGSVHEAPYRPDLLRGIYHMYIYTDLCENTQVGNVQVPLLRTVPLQDVSYGQVKSYTFTKPIYIPMSKRHFDTIEVELRDDSGDLLPLDEGKTVLVLHIRPRQV